MDIYLNINTIYNEEQWYREDNQNVNFFVKKFEILELPFIISFNTKFIKFYFINQK